MENFDQRKGEEAYDALEHPQAPLADHLEQKPAYETTGGGGGGGTPGGTMLSRLYDVIPNMDAAEAADTGGQAIEPSEIVPLHSAGEIRWAGTEQAQSDLQMGAAIHEAMEGGRTDATSSQAVPPSSKDLASGGNIRAAAMEEQIRPTDTSPGAQTVSADTPGYLGEYEP